MPDAPILNDLDIFLSRSRDLLVLADKQDWDAFENLRSKRDSCLETIDQALEPQASAELIKEVRERLENIATINEKLVILAKKSEITIQTEFKSTNYAKKAITAYKF